MQRYRITFLVNLRIYIYTFCTFHIYIYNPIQRKLSFRLLVIDDFPDKTCSPSERINRSRVNARRDRLMRCTIALSGRNTGDGHKGDRQGRLELRVQDIFRRFRARVRYPFSFRRAREDFEGKGQGDLEVQTAFLFPPLPLFSLSSIFRENCWEERRNLIR